MKMSILLVLFLSLSVNSTLSTTVSALPLDCVFNQEFDDYIENFLNEECTPDDSIHLAFINDTDIVHVKGYGANPDLDIVHTLGKISQLLTVTAIMQLYEDGLIDIMDDINGYLPYSLINPNFPTDAIRIKDLLSAKSTLIDTEDYWDLVMDETYNFTDMFYDLLHPSGVLYNGGQCWLNIDPPSIQHESSSIAFDLLAYIVENVTTTDFEQYVTDNILTPLGMTNTKLNYTEYDEAKLANQTVVASFEFGIDVPDRNYDGRGSTGWRTTIEDFVKFTYNLMHGEYDGTAILNSTSIDLITSDYGSSYGFGVWVNDIIHPEGTEEFTYINSNVKNFPHDYSSMGCYDTLFFNEKFGCVLLCDAHLVSESAQPASVAFYEFIENTLLKLRQEGDCTPTTKTSYEYLIIPVAFAFLATILVFRRRKINIM